MENFNYQDYSGIYSQSINSTGTTLLKIALIILICLVIYYILYSLILGTVFKKAGRSRWAAFVPIYNSIVLFQLTDYPLWLIIFELIPNSISESSIFFSVGLLIVKIVISFLVNNELAHRFGKSTLIGVITTIFPIIGLSILAFGNGTYSTEKETGLKNIVSKSSNQTLNTDKVVDSNHCPGCGNIINSSLKICNICGYKIKD